MNNFNTGPWTIELDSLRGSVATIYGHPDGAINIFSSARQKMADEQLKKKTLNKNKKSSDEDFEKIELSLLDDSVVANALLIRSAPELISVLQAFPGFGATTEAKDAWLISAQTTITQAVNNKNLKLRKLTSTIKEAA